MRTSHWPLAVGVVVAGGILVSPVDMRPAWLGLLAVPATAIAGYQARRLRGTKAFTARIVLFVALVANLLVALLRSAVPSPPVFLLDASVWRTVGVVSGVTFAALVIRSEHLGQEAGPRNGTAPPLSDRSIRSDIATLLDSFAVAAALGLVLWVFVVEPWGARERLGTLAAYPALWLVLDTAVTVAAFRAWRRTGGGPGPHLWLLLMLASAAVADAFLIASNVTGSTVLWTWTCLWYGVGMLSMVMLEIDPRFGVAAVPPAAAAPVPRGGHLAALFALLVPVALLPFHPPADTVADTVGRSLLVAATVGTVVARIAYGGLQLVRADHDARWRARHDSLTGLVSRFAFLGEVSRRLAGVGPSDETALLFIDLDGFKEVNDTRGHDVGDALLVEVARRLEEAVRSTDLVGRLGGDEFVVLIGDRNLGPDDAEEVAGRIAARLAEPVDESSPAAGCTITASIGGCVGLGSVQCEDMLAAADEVMYSVKHNGKNGVAWTRISAGGNGRVPLQSPASEPQGSPTASAAVQPKSPARPRG